MVTSMGIRHAKPYTFRDGHSTKLEQRLFKAWQLNNHSKNSSISSKPNRAHICTISMPRRVKSIFSSCYLFRIPFSSTTIGDENPIRTLGDYSKPSHEGYRNTIELPAGNNVVPLRSDTIWLVQNGCSFHRLRSEDPNQHLKDFLKLADSLDLDGENKERTRLHLFQFSLRDQASNWLERLPARSITTWEDLTTRFLAQLFQPGRTKKLRNDILIRTIDQSAGDKLRDRNAKESWALLEDLALYDNESWNDPRDFAKPVKAIALPQDVPSTSDRRLIELKNQVQCLMEAYLAPTQPTQVNKITTSCEICSGPHDTRYCMEDPEQAFVEYASSRTDEAGGLVSNFMASQEARLSKFEVDFKQQQSEMTNKINIVLKAITDQITGTLPSDTVKNPKLSTYLVLSDRSYPTEMLNSNLWFDQCHHNPYRAAKRLL
ncbi:MAK10-like protein [Tanacetum coccineum]